MKLMRFVKTKKQNKKKERTKLDGNDTCQYTEERNPQPHYINIHFPTSFNSLWFLVNTH